MHVGKLYPMSFNAQRMARARVQAGLPRRLRAWWATITGPIFQPMLDLDTASGLAEETPDGQSVSWEFEYDDPADTKLIVTHSLIEDLTPLPGWDCLQDEWAFELKISGVTYGTTRRLTTPAGSLFIYSAGHPQISVDQPWVDLFDPDEFSTAALRWAAATWEDSPEWTPYRTAP